MNNRKAAGLNLLFISLFPVGIWYIYLTVAVPPNSTFLNNLNILLADANELKPIFNASITASIISMLCAFTYFSKASKSKAILILLLIICVAQAAIAFWFTSWYLAIIYSLPAVLAYLALKNPNTYEPFSSQ